jgi:hypothetical protein
VTSARRRGSRAQLYEMARARLSNSDLATGDALSLADRHLLERYLGLAGFPETSERRLASETGMTRHALERRIAHCLGLLLGQGELGRPCGVCGRSFVPPYLSSRRTTCSVECERQHHRLGGTADRLREPARRQGRALRPQLAELEQPDFERLSPTEVALVRSYYGLDGNPQSTKKELALRFGLSVWKVDSSLKRAVAVLLARRAPARSAPRYTANRGETGLHSAVGSAGGPWLPQYRISGLMHSRSSAPWNASCCSGTTASEERVGGRVGSWRGSSACQPAESRTWSTPLSTH